MGVQEKDGENGEQKRVKDKFFHYKNKNNVINGQIIFDIASF
jgi:hypothetical protein